MLKTNYLKEIISFICKLEKRLMKEVTCFGGIIFYLFFSLYVLITREYIYFLVLTAGLIIIYLGALIIRIFYFKSRPNSQKYNNFLEKIDASSFPSIHSARITFLLIFLIFISLKNFILIYFYLFISLIVFYSRVYLKKHYFIDIIGGILLGIITSFLIILLCKGM